MSPVQQLAETRVVLGHRLTDGQMLDARMSDLVAIIEPVTIERFVGTERAAKARLQEHCQKDWPVLAAALSLDADIWSNDRDFFGVGVPVWSTRNIDFIEAEAA